MVFLTNKKNYNDYLNVKKISWIFQMGFLSIKAKTEKIEKLFRHGEMKNLIKLHFSPRIFTERSSFCCYILDNICVFKLKYIIFLL